MHVTFCSTEYRGYRREREGAYYNSTELRGMDSTLPHLKDSQNAYWAFNGPA